MKTNPLPQRLLCAVLSFALAFSAPLSAAAQTVGRASVQASIGAPAALPAPQLDLSVALNPALGSVLGTLPGMSALGMPALPATDLPQTLLSLIPPAALSPAGGESYTGLRVVSVSEPLAVLEGRLPGPSASGALREASADAGVFDGVKGLGILPLEGHPFPEIALDPKPEFPGDTEVERVTGEEFRSLTARSLKGPGLLRRLVSPLIGPAKSVVLPGNPQDAAGVEAALRGLIAQRPEISGGLGQNDLGTVLKAKVKGQAGLDDMVYVKFRQTLDGLPVEGTYLNFVVQIKDGKAAVVSLSRNLYPALAVNTQGTLNDAQILGKAAERTGIPPQDAESELKEAGGRRVMHLGGRWRAVQLLVTEKKAIMAAVDVNTGETFAWDPRIAAHATHEGGRLTDETPSAADASGTATGIAVEKGPQKPDASLTEMAVGHVQVVAADGKSFYADGDGKFTVPGSGEAPVQITVKLTGRWAAVVDQQKREVVLTVTAKPGETLQVRFNPEKSRDENLLAQIMGYIFTNRVHDWVVKAGIDLEGLNKPIPVNSNIDDDCNAYYTPWSPSLNFFKSSSRCVNSGYDSVVFHEYGHHVDNVAGGITNGGLSEAWGDILSMFITGNPIVGEGFLKGQTPDYIRHGENKYKYRAGDEVHRQGEAYMGFAWKLRKSLIAAMGEAQGAALATALVIPVLLSGARDIPAAVQQVALRDTDGKYFKFIQDAAAVHGLTVKPPKKADEDSGNGTLSALDDRSWWGSRLAGAAAGMVRSIVPAEASPRTAEVVSPQAAKEAAGGGDLSPAVVTSGGQTLESKIVFADSVGGQERLAFLLAASQRVPELKRLIASLGFEEGEAPEIQVIHASAFSPGAATVVRGFDYALSLQSSSRWAHALAYVDVRSFGASFKAGEKATLRISIPAGGSADSIVASVAGQLREGFEGLILDRFTTRRGKVVAQILIPAGSLPALVEAYKGTAVEVFPEVLYETTGGDGDGPTS